MILISDEDLKGLIQEAVTNAVDGITKKIASRAAVMSYNNQIFGGRRRYRSVSQPSGGCGSDDGGCGSSTPSYTPPPCSCGSSSSRSSGGCGGGGFSSRSSGGCGGGYESGGC